jgi:hypothetical protein
MSDNPADNIFNSNKPLNNLAGKIPALSDIKNEDLLITLFMPLSDSRRFEGHYKIIKPEIQDLINKKFIIKQEPFKYYFYGTVFGSNGTNWAGKLYITSIDVSSTTFTSFQIFDKAATSMFQWLDAGVNHFHYKFNPAWEFPVSVGAVANLLQIIWVAATIDIRIQGWTEV